jgi:hypothetical protein
MAVFADLGASLLVVFNGLRLQRATHPAADHTVPVVSSLPTQSYRRGNAHDNEIRFWQGGPPGI